MNNSLAENVEFLAEYRNWPKTLNKKTGERAVSQTTIEDHTGVAQTTISGILTQGKMPRLSTLEKLARGFNVELWQLLAPTTLLKMSLEIGIEQVLQDDQFAELIRNFAAADAEARSRVCEFAGVYAAHSRSGS